MDRVTPTVILHAIGESHRVLIAGGPQTGKTALAERAAHELKREATSTDWLVQSHEWSESSLAVSHWFDDERPPWIIEGVAVPRALRKWLARNPEGTPADLVVWLDEPVTHQTPGQAAMHKGCCTVWNQILPELQARGQRVLCRDT